MDVKENLKKWERERERGNKKQQMETWGTYLYELPFGGGASVGVYKELQ